MIAGVIPEFRWGVDFAQAWRPVYPVDGVRYWDRPRTVERTVTLSGIEDAWITGTDYYVSGRVRWLGRGQYAADAGFAALVRAARDGAVRCYPDPVTAPDWFVLCYVEGVDAVTPEPEADFTMASELTLRGASGATVSPVWVVLAPGARTGVTFSRASTGTFFDHSAGLVRSAGNDVLRVGWVRTSAGRWESGLVLEGSVSPLLTHSEALDNAAWTKLGGGTVPATTDPAPDGTATADAFQEGTSAAANHGVTQTTTATTASVAHTLSAFVERVGRRWVWLQMDDGGGVNGVRAFFDLANGVAGTVSSFGTGSGAVATITPQADRPGWYRVALSGVPASSGSTVRAICAQSTGDAVLAYTGDGASQTRWWGINLVQQGFPSSYMPRLASGTTTRSADTFSRTLASTPLPTPRRLTLYHRGALAAPWATFGNTYAVVLGDGSTVANLGVGKSGASTAAAYVQVGAVTSFASVTITPPVAGDVLEWAATLNADGSITATVAINGLVAGTATSAVPATSLLGRAWGAQTLLAFVGGAAPWLSTHTLVLAGARTLSECRAFAGVSA